MLSSCIKSNLCNQRTLIPINFSLDNQYSFSYVDIDIGSESIPILERLTFWGDQSGFKIYSDTIDVTDQVKGIPWGGKIFVKKSYFCLDGSYKIFRDTIIKK